ncbi:P-type ATPase, partial [Enterococcus faecium]
PAFKKASVWVRTPEREYTKQVGLEEGLRALLSLIPDTVRVSRLNGDVTIPAAEVRELDILVVGAGERVATDGVIVEGRSSLDTSAITGDSIPVEVGPGD